MRVSVDAVVAPKSRVRTVIYDTAFPAEAGRPANIERSTEFLRALVYTLNKSFTAIVSFILTVVGTGTGSTVSRVIF